ncbi:DUF389 domain-containing protein [Deinococcus sp. HMF7604]|uniref:DUF389 domain-containing protein n=1 Tax=Deinococcus betulae TaxID=2873312 RepID=UPI001CCB36A8|nr:DUF389 domain-containing protein [Deinococcus betulae]MBZ9752543.1 DUF389 domain-containing protein [Deinococcus betulae]
MHRTMTITVPADRTHELSRRLAEMDAVVSLTLSRGASLKPPGDVFTAHVLNRGADAVLKQVEELCPHFSATTSELSAILDPQAHDEVLADVDEALWEEIAAGLRHQIRVTSNFMALMALGGLLSTIGMVSGGTPQVLAFVAASIVAPGFEPFAKVALGLVVRQPKALTMSLWSAAVGYAVFIAVAGLSFWGLRLLGVVEVTDFTGNPELARLANPTAVEVLFSACGALAGAVVMAAYRERVIAGALVALVLMPAAATVGMALSLARWDLAWEGLERLGLDALLVVGLCALVFGLKQRFVHRRRPLL